MTAIHPIRATGIVTIGTSAVLNERKNRMITLTTSSKEMPRAIRTSRIDAEMKSASSDPMMTSMPSGNVSEISLISARTRFDISIVLA